MGRMKLSGFLVASTMVVSTISQELEKTCSFTDDFKEQCSDDHVVGIIDQTPEECLKSCRTHPECNKAHWIPGYVMLEDDSRTFCLLFGYETSICEENDDWYPGDWTTGVKMIQCDVTDYAPTVYTYTTITKPTWTTEVTTTTVTQSESFTTTSQAPTARPLTKPVKIKVTIRMKYNYRWRDAYYDQTSAAYKAIDTYIREIVAKSFGYPSNEAYPPSSFTITLIPPSRKRRADNGEGFEFDVETTTTIILPIEADTADINAASDIVKEDITQGLTSLANFDTDGAITGDAAIVSTAFETVDCFINNGGCSHTCDRSGDNHYCRCPTCWEMSEDQMTCRPMSNKIQTRCLSNAMEITLHRCVFQESHDYKTARMSDGDCAFKKNDDRLTMTMTNPLGECGMQLDYKDGQIIYSNRMTIEASKTNGLIVVEPDIDWGFTCKYETDYTVDKEATITSDVLNHVFDSQNGRFSFDFKFYETEMFEVVQDNPLYQVGQQINFGLIMNENIKLDKLEFVATTCTVSAGDFSFRIWDYSNLDRCLPDQYIAFTRYQTSNAFAKFSYHGLQFRPDEGSAPAQQRITCDVKVCHEDDENSACKNGCYGI